MKRQRLTFFMLGALLLAACGERDARYDKRQENALTQGLEGSVAVFDEPLNRVLMLTSPSEHQLGVKPLPIGQGVVEVAVARDRSRLFVLSDGAGDGTDGDSEGPRLTVIDGGTQPKVEHVYELDGPLKKLATDPEGDWLVAYEGGGVLTNPNELVLFDLKGLSKGKEEPIPRTIRSFGGSPQEFIFTDVLNVPGGARRFLIVRTEKDVTLIDLSDVERDEVTVKLPEEVDGEAFKPLEVVYSDGDPDDDADARLAVRLENSSDVVLLELGPSAEEGKAFSPTVNIVDAKGVPTAIDFVNTDGGLRLAALVPSKSQATLIDPRTTLSETVDLPIGYSRMRRITDSLVEPSDDDETPDDEEGDDGDVALLYSPSQEGVAFWSLGETSGSPFRSIDALNDLDIAVSAVSDVPGTNSHIKILSSDSYQGFYVLDLRKREAFPLPASDSGYELSIAPDGGRFWVFSSWSPEFAMTSLENLHPPSFVASRNVTALYDIKRADNSRAALLLHGTDGRGTGDVAVTLFDAYEPDSADTRYFGGLLLEGL